MEFKPTVNKKWLWTDYDSDLISGYTGANELRNACSNYVGFYTEFQVDYPSFNITNDQFKIKAEDIEVCFKNTSSFENDYKVFVTDYLKIITNWKDPP